MGAPAKAIFLCCHCGNRTPHELKLEHSAHMLWDEIPEPIFDDFNFFAYACQTCQGLSVLGCFSNDEAEPDFRAPPYPRLYPVGPDIDPPVHTVSGGNPVPEPVRRAYREAWPLQHTAPGAFANQIRRALEFICDERGAKGKTLYEQLQVLAKSGAFPPGLVEVSTLMRAVGNIGSHASEKEVSRWDAELLDALFRMILEYLYIGPARLERLRERIKL